jgi:hypothetical protein
VPSLVELLAHPVIDLIVWLDYVCYPGLSLNLVISCIRSTSYIITTQFTLLSRANYTRTITRTRQTHKHLLPNTIKWHSLAHHACCSSVIVSRLLLPATRTRSPILNRPFTWQVLPGVLLRMCLFLIERGNDPRTIEPPDE